MTTPHRIAFVCLHGSAKSLIAAEHLNRLARFRGIQAEADSMGMEPDAEVPANVVQGLAGDGIDVAAYAPRPATSARLATATHVVSFGCDVSAIAPDVRAERWNDLPLVSDGFDAARDAIVARVQRLLDMLTGLTPGEPG